MLMKGQPGDIFVMEQGYCQELAQADDDGVIRNVQGRSYSSGVYSVVYRIDECEACGNDDIETFKLILGTDVLVCQACGHR